MDVIKVSSRSVPKAVAGAICAVIRESGSSQVEAVGAGAVNQAVKAIAVARVFLSEEGIDAVCLPSFEELEVAGDTKTGIKFTIEKR
ncbi:MAG: stage V sporulation protein S [Ruminiclostridium sp.]|nr:stage V sporulation protein S [Ruminiclostridium sp.]